MLLSRYDRPSIIRTLLGAALLVLFSTPIYAAKHALLIGVGDYKVKPLSGPSYDVEAMRKVLIRRWGFVDDQIDTLLDEQATRKNILSAVGGLEKKTRPGDDVFIYLSGHGTSADDRELNIPLPTSSGAFIPYDITNLDSVDDIVEKLIIGQRDLQPLLSKLDSGNRNVFVAIDACYSGNAVRGKFSEHKLPQRFLKLKDLLPKRGFGDDLSGGGNSWSNSKKSESNESYPYKNIYYLSASGEHEPAQDIPPKMLSIYPTVDGNPHGAFTDTLLRILNKEMDADIDQNGQISYGELKTTVRNLMRIRGFDHTPQGLPSLANDSRNLSSNSIFGSAQNNVQLALATKTIRFDEDEARSATILPEKDLSIRLGKALRHLSKEARKLKHVRLVKNKYDLRIQKDGKDVLLINSAGDLVTRIPDARDNDVLEAMRMQALAHAFMNTSWQQNFGLEFDMFGVGKGSTATDGEQLGFSIKSAERAHLMILNIDPLGQVSVIYPYMPTELEPIQERESIDLKGITEIRPPYGRDYMLAFAFSELTPEMERLRGQSFGLDSQMADVLKSLLGNKNLKKGWSSLELVTANSVN